MTDVNLDTARHNMVEQQIRPWEVLDGRVLEAVERLAREAFVPTAYRNLAYADLQIPIGGGEVMMEPRVEARMVQALDPTPGDRALEIGTGSGYVTALLASLAGEVVSVERIDAFRESAGARLRAEGIGNAKLVAGDAARGWDDGNRYDTIAVTGSLPEIHEGFHRCLTIGGRLFLIVGQAPIMEALLITRVDDDQWTTESLFDTSVPALVGAPHSIRFEL